MVSLSSAAYGGRVCGAEITEAERGEERELCEHEAILLLY